MLSDSKSAKATEIVARKTGNGAWADLPNQVPDALVDATIPSAPYAQIAEVLVDWYGDLSQWITFPMPADPTWDGAAADVIARLKTA